ncbi:unnamed protein product, partial [marine sediment metagenome]
MPEKIENDVKALVEELAQTKKELREALAQVKRYETSDYRLDEEVRAAKALTDWGVRKRVEDIDRRITDLCEKGTETRSLT